MSTRLVTLIETTAGDTFSKMSAKDMGAPGGGAKLELAATATAGALGLAPVRPAALSPAPAAKAVPATKAPARAPKR